MDDARRATTRVNGIELHYAELGEGAPLVLVHGLADSHRTFRRVAPLLASVVGRRVIAVDLPGHGWSDRPDASYSVAFYVETLRAFVDVVARPDEAVDIAGHSFGGGIALAFALDHPERVRCLSLWSAGGLGRDVPVALAALAIPGAEALLERALTTESPLLLAALGGHAFEPDEQAWLAQINARKGTARAIARTVRSAISWRGQRDRLQKRRAAIARAPRTLIVWGEHDRVLPLRHARRARSLLPESELLLLPAAHHPHLEAPKPCARALVDFLA